MSRVIFENITDGEWEMIIRALYLQVEFWERAGPEIPASLRSEQAKAWRTLAHKIGQEVEG